VEDIRTLVVPEVEARGAELRWDAVLDVALPLPATQMRQILLNLLINAAHAVQASGWVRCRIDVIGKVCTLRVDNQGREIPPKRMAHLFEPFAESQGGNGLGLWVTYQLVTQLGGKIQARCADGVTTFIVSLPLDTTS
jgi:signal transduction histidine kinase